MRAKQPIRWSPDRFNVVDANQSVASALTVARRFPASWIVVYRHDRVGEFWYVYSKQEFFSALRSASSNDQLQARLLLAEGTASHAVEERSERVEPHLYPGALTLGRAVLVDISSHRVLAVGTAPVVIRHMFFGAAPTFVRRRNPRERQPQRKAKSAAKARGAREPSRRVLGQFHVLRVMFATDRELATQREGSCKFSNARSASGRVKYGICEVSIPHGHKIGEIESPNWWKLQFFRDPGKHVTLLRSEVLPVGNYFRLLKASINRSPDTDAFIFVHGYNVSFEAAALRTAQIAYDLQFQGAPILYSWPSRATLRGYLADEATIEVSAKLFQRFVVDVASKSGVRTLHIIAHSMGNRALLLALERLAASSGRPAINNVILAAPDIDAERFYQIAEAISGYPSRVTLYASSRDKAIRASMKLHDAPRAGESGENIVITPSVDTVDASRVDTDFLGHAQFAKRRELLGDIFELLSKGTPPHRRFTLEPKVHQRGRYWAFRP